MSNPSAIARTFPIYGIAVAGALALTLLVAWREVWTVPGYLALLAVAAIARLWGVRAAMAGTLVIAVLLWFWLLPHVFPGSPLRFRLLRVLLFLAVSVLIALIVLQKDQAEERYRTTVDLSPAGIGMISADGCVVYANPSMLRMLGATAAAQVVGKNPLDFIHADDRPRASERLARLLSGQSVDWVEETWIRVDGKIIDVEVAAVPALQRGKVVGQAFARDITERKEAEAKAAESHERFEALFNATLDAILFVDARGRYVDANTAASELLGYTHEEILSHTIGDFSPPDRKAEFATLWREAEAAKRMRAEFVIDRKDARTLDIEFQVVADVVTGLHAVILRDITARRAAEGAVRQLSARMRQVQEEERRRIARQLHDETAQNLAAIRLHLLRIARVGTANDPAAAESVAESLALLDESIDQVRTLSYLLQPPLIEHAGLVAALRWYVLGFQDRTGIATTLEAAEEMERLPRDVETSAFRIVQEALTNIQRHSGSAVAIVHVERKDRDLHVRVEDRGRGLPAELRSDPSAATLVGAGIAGIQQRAHELGGTMNLQSSDGGTIVDVVLPTAS
jgi:two-component system, NarL family, sensor kinase